jgi:dTDP-4-dehydrorhamnose reductase
MGLQPIAIALSISPMPPPPRKLLIIGASGFLGWHVCQIAQDSWQIYGTYHCHNHLAQPVNWVTIDLTDLVALPNHLTAIQPDAIIHLAALAQPNACQAQPERSYQINVLASIAIAEYCAQANIPLVFTSSEQVFDGQKPPYKESDRPTPINLYGEHKLAAEIGILERHPSSSICRMPLMFGFAPTAPSFVQAFIERLRSPQPLEAFTDEIRTPVSGFDAAQGLLIALETQFQGILHLGGIEALSRYDIAQQLVAFYKIPKAQIKACCQADVIMAAPRPLNLTLDSAIAFTLGYSPQSFQAALLASASRHVT